MKLPLFAGCAALTLLAACRGPLAYERERVEVPGVVQWVETLRGEGPGAQEGERIAIHYTAWLMDGTPVDSTYDRGTPITVTLGEAPIEGWNHGLVNLALGGRRSLVIAAAMAYGEQGVAGLIPPGSDLRFEIERVPLAESAPVPARASRDQDDGS